MIKIEAPACCPLCGTGKLLLDNMRVDESLFEPGCTTARLLCQNSLCRAEVQAKSAVSHSALFTKFCAEYEAATLQEKIACFRETIGGFQFAD